jgi:nucleoid DNA-binding protein
MTKLDIINSIAWETRLSKVKAAQAVDAILAIVKENLSSGEPVILRRFGSFRVRHKQGRMGRNPRTGAHAYIPARKVVAFRSGKRFRETINAGVGADTS